MYHLVIFPNAGPGYWARGCQGANRYKIMEEERPHKNALIATTDDTAEYRTSWVFV